MTSEEQEKKCNCEENCNCECDCENNKCEKGCVCESEKSDISSEVCSAEQDEKSDSASEVAESKEDEKNYITFDQFKKVEMTIGKIVEVEVVEDADKLLKLTVDFGDMGTRQIVSGIREYFEDPQSIVGKRVPFATNLQPRTIRGLESNGMIVAVSDKNGNGFSLLEAGEHITPGSSLS